MSKSNKLCLMPPKGKRFNALQKLKKGVFFDLKKSIISFLPDSPKSSQTIPKTWKSTAILHVLKTYQIVENAPLWLKDTLYEHPTNCEPYDKSDQKLPQFKNKWTSISCIPHPPTHICASRGMIPRRNKFALVGNLFWKSRHTNI